MSLSRRGFLQTGAAASLAWAAGGVLADDTKMYRTALIGTGWWGMNIFRAALDSGACKPVAMCDVDENFLNPAADEVDKKAGTTVKRYKDYRELLEKEHPEIVIVGTPDHWHPLIMIAAVKAGAHVYVEKPISHTIYEGRAMVKAARETGRVVQVGTHRRTSAHNIAARDFIRSGKAGKIGMCRAFVLYGGNGPEKPLKNVEVPKGLDWDMWCGPAPLRPYNGGDAKNPWRGAIHPRGFRNYLDYANGTLGDWGVHWMDQILWIMEEKYPRKVFSTGGRPIKGPPVFNDNEQTSDAPDHQIASFEFESFSVSWEHRQFGGNKSEKTHPDQAVGCYFYGTEGVAHVGWLDGFTFYPNDKSKEVVHVDAQLDQPDGQNIKALWADFLDAIKTNRRPISDIEDIHRSTNMSLLGMLSLKLGRSVVWDGEKEKIVGDGDANKLLYRKYRKGWEYPKS